MSIWSSVDSEHTVVGHLAEINVSDQPDIDVVIQVAPQFHSCVMLSLPDPGENECMLDIENVRLLRDQLQEALDMIAAHQVRREAKARQTGAKT